MLTRPATAVDAFLDALQSGDWRLMQDHYAPDVIFSANVPYWHFALRGSGVVISQLMEWFPKPGRLTELDVTETADGLLMQFEWRVVTGNDPDLPYGEGVRQIHRLQIRDGRIIEQRVYCIGVMDPSVFADFESHAPSITAYEF